MTSVPQSKRHRLVEWVKNHDPSFFCLIKVYLTLKVKGWIKSSKKTGPGINPATILIPEKVNFMPRLIRRDKEENFILFKVTIDQEDITILILNIYAANFIPNFIKRILPSFKFTSFYGQII